MIRLICVEVKWVVLSTTQFDVEVIPYYTLLVIIGVTF